jgi:hypothetical protein
LGNCESKLDKATVAISTWRVEVPTSGYPPKDIGGIVPVQELRDIVKTAKRIRTKGCTPKVSCDVPLCKPKFDAPKKKT